MPNRGVLGQNLDPWRGSSLRIRWPFQFLDRDDHAIPSLRGAADEPARPEVELVERKETLMGKRLYVGNLSYDTTEEGLRNAFSENGGTVADIHILIDRETGRSRGFGFVEMSTDEEAQAAIEAWDGNDLDGRRLKVNEARERR